MNPTLDALRTIGVRAQTGTTSVRMRRPAWPAVKQQVNLDVVRAEDPGPFREARRCATRAAGTATYTESDMRPPIWFPNDQLAIFR